MLHPIVFPGNEFSSLLDAKVARLVIQSSLGILPAILAKHLRPDLLGLDVFFLQRSVSQNQSSGGRTCVSQIRTWCRGIKLEEEVSEMLALVSED